MMSFETGCNITIYYLTAENKEESMRVDSSQYHKMERELRKNGCCITCVEDPFRMIH